MAEEPAVRKMYQQKKLRLATLALAIIFLGVPFVIYAAVSMEADQMCIASWDYGCPCGTVCKKGGPPGGQGCPCGEAPPGGQVTGKCVAAINCKGIGTEKGGIGDLKGMLDILKVVMDVLKKKEQGGDGGGGGGDGGQFSTTTCRTYYRVTTPSTDPCAYYVPPTSSSLFDGSASGTNSNASTELVNTLSVGVGSAFGVEPSVGNATVTTTNVSTSTPASALSKQAVDVGAGRFPEGAFGDIVTTDTGGTIYAGSRDAGNNIEVSGFFGADSFVGKMQGAVGNMCKTRPWAGSLVARVIPESFFDGLCSWRGYQVGTPAPPPLTQPAPRPTQKSKAATTSSAIPQPQAGEPRVDIWAVPESVSLGLRASIFWSTKNVDSCTVSSSGGNFNESKLSGGAATVPLTNDTTFTISCTAPDGKTLSDEVTVTISP